MFYNLATKSLSVKKTKVWVTHCGLTFAVDRPFAPSHASWKFLEWFKQIYCLLSSGKPL
jgi:hypothetical protein